MRSRLLFYFIATTAFYLAGSSNADSNPRWSWYRQVQTVNDDGNILRFDRYSNRAVRGCLILRTTETGAFTARLSLYKVDDYPLRKIEHAKVKEASPGKWILWEMPEDAAPPIPSLIDFLEGKRVVFQYYTGSTIIKETAFNLEGCRKELMELLRPIQ